VRRRTLGVEEEFFVFDANASRLLDIGPQVVANAERDGEDDAQFEKELKRAQAELGTAPTDDLATLERDLRDRRTELARAAAQDGARLVASGTCPVRGTTQTTDDERYRQMAHRFAAIERRQLVCAMHVHVDIDSADEGVRIINGVAPWLPLLLALSANSPYAGGEDTGYASFRRLVWDAWPTAGVTAPFADAAEYERTVRELIDTGAARDRGMIYFDARLSANYPTVELRICDVCTEVEDAVLIAGLCRALVSSVAADDRPQDTRPELLRAAAWRAARYGMARDLVDLRAAPRLVPAWDLVDDFLDTISSGLDAHGDAASTRERLARLRERGTGAERQRAAAADGGLDNVVDVLTLRS
jgi:carboxylate-amine ligase